MYHIEELAQEFRISVWTIRKYRKLGLLSPPLSRPYTGNRRVWGDIHYRELRKIMAMKENNRTLDDMRDVLHPEETE